MILFAVLYSIQIIVVFLICVLKPLWIRNTLELALLISPFGIFFAIYKLMTNV